MLLKNENVGVSTKQGRRRIQLDFSPEAYENFVEIRLKSGGRTNAEVVRNALRLYDWYLDLKAAGSKLQVVEGEAVKEVEILF